MNLEELRGKWAATWPKAVETWSRYTRLREPRWCLTKEQEKEEKLLGSFAMIRLADHAVVVSLRQVDARRLQAFPVEILAHEIGHHVYCPANITDHARGMARIRRALPTLENQAPLVSNLFTDLLINDKLQRLDGLDMAGVYRALGVATATRAWAFYMRICEILWGLSRGSLAPGKIDDVLEGDAQLGARVVRAYARDWVKGAGRFAALCLPYLLQDKGNTLSLNLRGWLDTENAGEGADPFGLSEVEEDEEGDAAHPAEDEELSGVEKEPGDASSRGDSAGRRDVTGGRKGEKSFRGPVEYGEILKSIGMELDEGESAARYYRERALPHLIHFPVREVPQAVDPLPEGTEPWDTGTPLEEIDWTQTAMG
ncbi:MAG TPA: VWA domain-containing protein, partial [Thermodesulfobacteriota bacterium]|nr:VWA domain-containing protein [Thermodesulfobacteriota bacterium]